MAWRPPALSALRRLRCSSGPRSFASGRSPPRLPARRGCMSTPSRASLRPLGWWRRWSNGSKEEKMFRLRAPSDPDIRRFLASQRDLPFTYPEVGATRAAPPAGYNVDHNRIQLGSGPEIFQRAVVALQRWEMFSIGWVRLCWPDTPAVGAIFGVAIRHFGFWSLNSARIAYVLEEDGPIQRYGFAYGTLPGHAECGEERFTVEWRHDDDTV